MRCLLETDLSHSLSAVERPLWRTAVNQVLTAQASALARSAAGGVPRATARRFNDFQQLVRRVYTGATIVPDTMQKASTPPRVFISYTHDSEEHKNWIRRLAEDLADTGVDVLLDQWDLSPGHDLIEFMHKGITSAERVLMVCSGRFLEKVNRSEGGVAYEKLLVSAELAAQVGTKKFIPLVRCNPGPQKIPTFLGMRLYLDFTDDSRYESVFRDLVAELHGVPKHARPALGSNPFSLLADRPYDAPRLLASDAGGEFQQSGSPVNRVYEIKQEPAGRVFRAAWRAAGQHLNLLGKQKLRWLRAELTPPLAEHLSFAFGNQLFFVFLQVEGAESPSSEALFLRSASEASAIPAVLSMILDAAGNFRPRLDGWGLRRLGTNERLVPEAMADDAILDMSSWELHDFAVQVVANQLAGDGIRVLSKQSSPHIDPSIWYEDESGLGFVVVRAARYPSRGAPRPKTAQAIAAACASRSSKSMFASVATASAELPFGESSLLPRGHGMFVRYTGLEPLVT